MIAKNHQNIWAAIFPQLLDLIGVRVAASTNVVVIVVRYCGLGGRGLNTGAAHNITGIPQGGHTELNYLRAHKTVY